MDIHLHMLTRSLIDETKARNRLGEFPKVVRKNCLFLNFLFKDSLRPNNRSQLDKRTILSVDDPRFRACIFE